jgi:hypothetical protein
VQAFFQGDQLKASQYHHLRELTPRRGVYILLAVRAKNPTPKQRGLTGAEGSNHSAPPTSPYLQYGSSGRASSLTPRRCARRTRRDRGSPRAGLFPWSQRAQWISDRSVHTDTVRALPAVRRAAQESRGTAPIVSLTPSTYTQMAKGNVGCGESSMAAQGCANPFLTVDKCSCLVFVPGIDMRTLPNHEVRFEPDRNRASETSRSAVNMLSRLPCADRPVGSPWPASRTSLR